MNIIALMLCVNHHRNGVFSGRCYGLSLPDPEQITLESPWLDRALKCQIAKRAFRLGANHEWPHHGEHEWVGNWCWNSVAVTPAVAVDVLNFAIGKGYQVTVCSERIAKALDAKGDHHAKNER